MLRGVIARKEGRAGEVCVCYKQVTSQRSWPGPTVPGTGVSSGKSEKAVQILASLLPRTPE